MMNYLVVLENGEQTIYPEIHYIFNDDSFHPEADAAEQNIDDISLIIDLNDTGDKIIDIKSISPSFQPTSHSIKAQVLNTNANKSQLIKLSGIGEVNTSKTNCLDLINELETRRELIRDAIKGYN